jgi:hypothetical protein
MSSYWKEAKHHERTIQSHECEPGHVPGDARPRRTGEQGRRVRPGSTPLARWTICSERPICALSGIVGDANESITKTNAALSLATVLI